MDRKRQIVSSQSWCLKITEKVSFKLHLHFEWTKFNWFSRYRQFFLFTCKLVSKNAFSNKNNTGFRQLFTLIFQKIVIFRLHLFIKHDFLEPHQLWHASVNYSTFSCCFTLVTFNFSLSEQSEGNAPSMLYGCRGGGGSQSGAIQSNPNEKVAGSSCVATHHGQ